MALSKLKKIIEITTFYAPVLGGVETQAEDLCKKLEKNNFEVEVLTTNSGRGREKIKNRTDEFDGIKVTRVNSLFSFSQFHKFAPGFFWELRKKEFDILHVHGIRKPELYMALFWAKWRRKKIVVSTHNPFTTVNRSMKMKLFILLHDLFFGRTLMRFVDHYFLLGESEKSILGNFGIKNKKMTVVGNAVNDLFFKEVEPDRDEFLEKLGKAGTHWDGIVLGVGRLNIMKGFQNLKYAIENLPKTLFLIVSAGDGGYQAYLETLFAPYENVMILPKFPRDQLLNYYAHADIFVLPSLHEPFGIVLLEAMAQKCAIIATKNGGPVEILNPNNDDRISRSAANYGIVLNPENQQVWYETIKTFMKDSELLAVYKNKAFNRVKEYKWDKILPKYLKVFS